MNLYEINSQLQQVISQADENGEINAALFDQLQMEKSEKQLNIVKFIKHLDNDVDILNKELERIKALKDQAAKRQEWLKGYLMASMEIDGINELDFTTFKAKIKKNPPQVVIDAEEQVPEEYITTKEVKTISKTAIKVALQSGKEVKGCRLEQGERLSIT